jgi:hypothetical protein
MVAAYPASMAFHTAVIAGCPPGSADCNQSPPLDGWITFWTPFLVVGLALILLFASVVVYRRFLRNRDRGRADGSRA